MDLFESVKPKKKERPKKEKPKKETKKQTENHKNFNDLENIKSKEIIEKEYNFSSEKDNCFSIFLNCDKFIKKPYYSFSKNKNIFLSNKFFNDFFDIKETKMDIKILVLNIDIRVIKYLVDNFYQELKSLKINAIESYNKIINIELIKELESSDQIKETQSNCFFCPFFDFNSKQCTI